ncbi:MAG TPA: beta-propeller fold lactonase family protein [Sphingomonas sp.]|jgi:YVTN family beta-propeller protein
MRPTFLFAALLLAAPLSAQTLLVGNKGEDSLSLVDLASGREMRRVGTGKAPHEIALSRDGRLAAVVNYGGRTIELFELPGGTKVRTIDLGADARPHGLVWLADGRLVATAEGRDALMLVDLSAVEPEVVAIPTGAKGSHMVAVSPDGGRAYVANMGSGTVGVFDLRTRAKLRDFAAGKQPEGIALSPDGRRLWVADRSGDALRAFDTARFAQVAEAPTGKTPIRVALTPDGRHVVTSDFGAGTISVFDAATAKPLRTIAVGRPGFDQVTILFSGDGKRLYVAETGIDRVAEVDFVAGRVLGRLPAGKNGDGLAISPVTIPR